jgi:hypothetical protein
MNELLIILLSLMFFQCNIDRTIDPVSENDVQNLNNYRNMTEENRLSIAAITEPDERLLLCLIAVDICF